jgi:alpha-L-fucosidase
MRDAGLRRGFYFSMLEYANPLYPGIRDGKPSPSALAPEEWNRRVNLPQLKELAENYEADIIWPDGEWDYPSERHCSKEYLAWLFNESKVKDTVVVNDRWGKECRGRHGGHYTTEYALEGGDTSGDSEMHPWEECRGIGNSFGYSRFETPKDYMSRERCVETLVSCVSRGGNLLLNVGPTADGRIPAILQARPLAIGRWLDVNGEAIYATTRWASAPKDFAKRRIYFTEKGNAVYMVVFPNGEDVVKIPGLTHAKGVSMLGTDAKIGWKVADGGLEIELPRFLPGESPVEFAPVFKITR